MADVKLDSSEVKALEKVFGITAPRELKKSMRRALSRTRSGSKTDTSKRVREEYNIQARRLKKDVVLTRPNYSSFSFRVIGRKRPISLISFRGKGGPPRQVASGVSAAVELGSREVIRHAFIRTGLNGNKQVFTRYARGGGLLPKVRMSRGSNAGQVKRKLRALKGPSVADMMLGSEVEKTLGDTAQDRFLTELQRNLKFLLGR
jgi:hypothetical protein